MTGKEAVYATSMPSIRKAYIDTRGFALIIFQQKRHPPPNFSLQQYEQELAQMDELQ